MASEACHQSQVLRRASTHAQANPRGDLNNTSSMRATSKPIADPSYAYHSLAMQASNEDDKFRKLYRPFLLNEEVPRSDWVSRLELATVTKMAQDDIEKTGERLRVLVLYGSLRKR